MNNHPDPSLRYRSPYRLHRLKFFPVSDLTKEQTLVQIPAMGHTDGYRQEAVLPPVRNRVWEAGTFGFDTDARLEAGLERSDTLVIAVLKDMVQLQSKQASVKNSEISDAAGGAAIVGFGNLSGNALKYISTLLIQRGFGIGPYGLYTICMDIVSLVTFIFTFGLDSAMIRYVSIYKGKRQGNLLRGLTIFCTILAGLTGMMGAIFLLVLAPWLAELRHEPRATAFLRLLSPLVPLMCLQLVWLGGLQGFKAFKWRIISERLLPPISLIFILVSTILFYHKVNAIAVATTFSTIIGTVFSLYFLFRAVSRHNEVGPEKYQLREWFGFAAPNFLTSITEFALQSVDTLLLTVFAITDVALGQYGAANRISVFILVPLLSFNSMFAPTIAELHSKGEHRKLEAMFKMVTKWTITLSLPIFLVATVFSRPLLAVSGNAFVSAWPLLIAFSIGTMVNTSTGCVGYMLLMTGHQKLQFINSLAAVIVNVVLGIILTPRYGAMGTAVSTGLAVCVVNLLKLLQVRLLLKVHPYRLDTLKPFAAGAISAILMGALLYALAQIHFILIVQLGLVPVFLALYAGLLRIFKISSEDRVVIDLLRKKLLRGK